ncbi:hypothetical protein ACFXD5_39810, partial [Streptomyces sp. NPDC059385]
MSRAARGKGKKDTPDPATQAFAEGLALVKRNPALGAVGGRICRETGCAATPAGGLVAVTSNGTLHVHPTKRAEPKEWAWALAHALLHLGFGHVPAAKEDDRPQPDRFDLAARCAVVNRFLLTFPGGRGPAPHPAGEPRGAEAQIAARGGRDGLPA